MKTNFFIYFLGMVLVSLWIGACKNNNDPEPNLPPSAFTITAKLAPNGTDVVLSWTKAKDPNGDVVTYAVVYKDTLAKNLTDTTYTIRNVGYNAKATGSIIAKDNRGATTPETFSITTGLRANSAPSTFVITAKLDPGGPNLVLSWTKAHDPDGDPLTYAVVYKDTLAKNVVDTTFTILNVGYNTTVTGSVIARDNQGASTPVTFSILTTVGGTGQRFRLKRTLEASNLYRYYNPTIYNYDKNGRLSSFILGDGKNEITFGSFQTTNLVYDEQGRLLSAEGEPDDGTGIFFGYRYSYEYDAQGNIISEKYYSANYGNHALLFRYEDRFEYGTTRFPVKKTTVSSTSQYVEQYTYSNGNLTRIDRSDAVGTAYDPIMYQYDANPNPFYGLTTASIARDKALVYSKNNVVANGYLIYTYDSNGLLVKQALPDPSVYRKSYEYETY